MSMVDVGTDSYVDELELERYAHNRGVTVSGSNTALLIRAMDWLELQPFVGKKTDEAQDLEWPRADVKVNGMEVSTTAVPARIKRAQMAAALIYDAGGDPLAALNPRVTQESVDGAVSVSYSDRGPLTTLYPILSQLIAPYIGGNSGTQFTVQRV